MTETELNEKVEAAQEELQKGAADTQADNPEVDLDSCWGDLVEATCWDLPDEVAAELCRRELGYVPHALRQFRPGIKIKGGLQ